MINKTEKKNKKMSIIILKSTKMFIINIITYKFVSTNGITVVPKIDGICYYTHDFFFYYNHSHKKKKKIHTFILI